MFEEYQNLFFIYSVGLISIVLLSSLTYFASVKFSFKINKKQSYYVFYFSFLFYTLSVLYLTFGKIHALHHYVDFATHLEILWRNSQGLGITTLMSEKYHGGSNWFAAHFTPIIYLTYVPAFAIWPSPFMIPVSETLFILSSLLPLWLISKKYLNLNLSRLFICSFLFYPTIFYTNLYGISYIELCIPLFLWMFYFFEEKKNILFIFSLLLCLMVREEVSLVTAFFGIYMIIQKRTLIGFATILISLIYFYTVVFLIMPSFRGEDFRKAHIAAVWFKDWGDTYFEMITYILFNPIDTLSKILIPPKIGNFIMILIPLLFIPLSKILIFFIAIPNLAMTFLSFSITHSSYILYYLSPSIPIFFYATISGLDRINNLKLINQNALIQSILVASISTTIFFGATPISIAFWNKDYKVGNFYTSNFHYSAYIEVDRHIAAKKIIKLIPKNKVISAEQHFMPLLYKNKKMIIFPSPEKEIDYVLIDRYNPKKTGGYFNNTLRKDPEFEYQKYFNNKNWEIIKEDLGVTLFKRIK